MKSSAAKVLLDTSFILPTLGISVSGAIMEGIGNLAEIKQIEIYYSRLSILESLWVATRIEDRTFEPETFALGLRSIIEGGRYARVEEGSEIFSEALKLYRLGHKDMIDNILYATATQLDMLLLTLDEELKKFVHKKELKDVFISQDELAALKEVQEPR